MLFMNRFYACRSRAPLFRNHVRSFKRNPDPPPKPGMDPVPPFGHGVVYSENMSPRTLLKPLGFTILFSTACYGGAAIWQYENMRAHAYEMMKKPFSGYMKKKSEIRGEFNKWWNKLSAGEKIFAPICFLNVLVFLAWRVPKFQPVMLRYFCSSPGSKHVYLPMLLSTFSHYSLFHLMANMYVLHSFSSGAVATMGKEQFVGLYMAAGVFSSFTSYVCKTLTRQPGLSLGASGAIMAVLGYVCTEYPETKLGIILLPFFTFSAGAAIKVVVGLDVAGVILGWKLFDHAAHLGGAALGIFWSLWGCQHLWRQRDGLLKTWHDIRETISK